MKKSILYIGKALNKTEQKSVTGSGDPSCYSGPFLVGPLDSCFYRINGVDFQGVVVDGCCC